VTINRTNVTVKFVGPAPGFAPDGLTSATAGGRVPKTHWGELPLAHTNSPLLPSDEPAKNQIDAVERVIGASLPTREKTTRLEALYAIADDHLGI
jgi:hypothetical protein